MPDSSYDVVQSSLPMAAPLHPAPEATSQAIEKSRDCTGTTVANGKHRQLLECTNMNWDRIEGNWKQFKGKVKEQWGKLADSDLDLIEGKRDQLVGKIQEQYGISKDEAERQVADFADRQRDYEKI
jgi:uncharacterized protein YjbJ (UPF0337 family)